MIKAAWIGYLLLFFFLSIILYAILQRIHNSTYTNLKCTEIHSIAIHNTQYSLHIISQLFREGLLRRKRDPSQTRSTLRRAHAAMRAPLSRDLAGNFKLLL